MNMPALKANQHQASTINPSFYSFINEEVLPLVDMTIARFWADFETLEGNYDETQTNTVVPISNTLLAIKVANSQWNSLVTNGSHSMIDAKTFLDEQFPLESGSHKDVKSYVVYYHHLLAFFNDGSQSGLVDPKQFVALCGHKCEPNSIVFKRNSFHVELVINKKGDIGSQDLANVQDIKIETTRTATMDFESLTPRGEHSKSAMANMKAYKMLKRILQNDHTCISKRSTSTRRTPDMVFTAPNGNDYVISGRSIELIASPIHTQHGSDNDKSFRDSIASI
jgi:malate synthase